MILTDESLMPLGKAYKGFKIANVPASYLFWLRDELWKGKKVTGAAIDVLNYIKENEDALKLELKNEKEKKK